MPNLKRLQWLQDGCMTSPSIRCLSADCSRLEVHWRLCCWMWSVSVWHEAVSAEPHLLGLVSATRQLDIAESVPEGPGVATLNSTFCRTSWQRTGEIMSSLSACHYSLLVKRLRLFRHVAIGWLFRISTYISWWFSRWIVACVKEWWWSCRTALFGDEASSYCQWHFCPSASNATDTTPASAAGCIDAFHD